MYKISEIMIRRSWQYWLGSSCSYILASAPYRAAPGYNEILFSTWCDVLLRIFSFRFFFFCSPLSSLSIANKCLARGCSLLHESVWKIFNLSWCMYVCTESVGASWAQWELIAVNEHAGYSVTTIFRKVPTCVAYFLAHIVWTCNGGSRWVKRVWFGWVGT